MIHDVSPAENGLERWRWWWWWWCVCMWGGGHAVPACAHIKHAGTRVGPSTKQNPPLRSPTSPGTALPAAGRRISLMVALLVNAFFGLLSASCRNLGQLMFLRLVAGLGVGGSMPIVFAQMSEFCPPATR